MVSVELLRGRFEASAMGRIVLFLYDVAMRLKRWHIPIVPQLLKTAIRVFFGCHIGLGVSIGQHTYLAYGGLGTVLHSGAVIGRCVYVGTNVTIGARNGSPMAPTVGDNCLIGTGAKLLGPIHIGRDSVIGANAVVVHDVPERSCVAGVPAKVIRTNIDIRKYRTKEDQLEIEPIPLPLPVPGPAGEQLRLARDNP